METITNLASTATTAASKLIYGDQTQNNETAGKEPVSGEKGAGTATDPYDQGNAATPLATADKTDFIDSSNNETAGKEPVSGALGSGTVTEPFDQGNNANATEKAAETSGSDNFLKLDPVHQAPAETTTSAPTTSKDDTSNVGMPVMSLAPDTAVLSSGTTSNATASNTTEPTGITDKVWKENPLDDISRSGAPGAGPEAPSNVTAATPDTAATTTTSTDAAIKTSAPDSVTASSGVYSGSEPRSENNAGLDTKTEAEKESEKRDTPAWTDTGVPSDSTKYEQDVAKQNAASPKGAKSALEKEISRKSESAESNEEKGGKMSHLKEKMKNKLHIGSKDK